MPKIASAGCALVANCQKGWSLRWTYSSAGFWRTNEPVVVRTKQRPGFPWIIATGELFEPVAEQPGFAQAEAYPQMTTGHTGEIGFALPGHQGSGLVA